MRKTSRSKTMAPGYDRKRTSPVKETDYEATSRCQGNGLAVIRVETTTGSGQASVTWRNQPSADDVLAAEQLLAEDYDKFSHGT